MSIGVPGGIPVVGIETGGSGGAGVPVPGVSSGGGGGITGYQYQLLEGP